jgi:biopolymer transport protein TolQ
MGAGPVVKLVLLVLVYFSVVSWAIIFLKFKTIQKAKKDSDAFLEFFWSKKRFDLIQQNLKDFANSPLTVLFRDGYHELVRNQRKPEEEGANFGIELRGADNVARALRRATTQEIQRLEKFLTFLATTGSTAPFIGLFGTVWGIMDSFRSIGQTGSASLAVVAPGISEALVATAIGLVAAIPAVVAYNYFVSKVSVLTGEMDNFSQEFLNIVEHMSRRK